MSVPVERVKVSFRLLPSDLAMLRALAAAQGISATEALRQAVATQQFVVQAYRDGGKLLIEYPDQRVRELVLRV